jgi:hypothetical protein
MSIMDRVTDLVSRATRRRAEKVEQSERSFDGLVIALCDEKKVTDDEIERILAEIDRTPNDLAAAVELELERRRLLIIIAEENELDEEEAELDRQATAINAAVAEARKKHSIDGAAINAARAVIAAKRGAIDNAKSLYREIAPPQKKTAAAQAGAKLSQATRRATFLKEQLGIAGAGGVRLGVLPGGDVDWGESVVVRQSALRAQIDILTREHGDPKEIDTKKRLLEAAAVEEAGYRAELVTLEREIEKLNAARVKEPEFFG